jgi:hypothetical protein
VPGAETGPDARTTPVSKVRPLVWFAFRATYVRTVLANIRTVGASLVRAYFFVLHFAPPGLGGETVSVFVGIDRWNAGLFGTTLISYGRALVLKYQSHELV